MAYDGKKAADIVTASILNKLIEYVKHFEG